MAKRGPKPGNYQEPAPLLHDRIGRYVCWDPDAELWKAQIAGYEQICAYAESPEIAIKELTILLNAALENNRDDNF